MIYDNIIKAKFLTRENRFIAHILVNGKEEICHVKNTGRCRELLIPNAEIYVQTNNDPKRKTKFSLIAVNKGGICFFIWKKPMGLPMRKRLIMPSGLWRMKKSTIPSGTT